MQLYIIREKIAPTHETKIPPIQGTPPAPWWGENEDRDILIGTVRHGYQQYNKIVADPTLCFAARFGILEQQENAINSEQLVNTDNDVTQQRHIKEETLPSEVQGEGIESSKSDVHVSEMIVDSDLPSNGLSTLEHQGNHDDVKMDSNFDLSTLNDDDTNADDMSNMFMDEDDNNDVASRQNGLTEEKVYFFSNS